MWKSLPIYDGRYLIDEYGNLFNSATNTQLHPSVFNNGYKVATLKVNDSNKCKKFLVHRLVAIAFLPNPNNYPIVMHLDNNPLNCFVGNLKWGTYSENNAQAIRDGLNTVPRPDNRKMYTIYNYASPVEIDCYGVQNVIKTIGYGTDSCIRNYLFRNTSFTQGPYQGWNIKLSDKKENVQRSSPDGRGYIP